MRSLSRPSSIRRRLLALVGLTAAAAVGIAALLLGAHEYRGYNRQLIARVGTVAEVLAANAAAAVEFGDRAAAGEMLATLSNEPAIVRAALVASDGVTVAEYRRPGSEGGSAAAQSAWAAPLHTLAAQQLEVSGESFAWRHGTPYDTVVVPVTIERERVGALHLQVTHAELYLALRYLVAALLATAVIACAAAIAATGWLRRRIVGPIQVLADAMADVAARQDFGVRVLRTTDDEVGQLFDRFNDMLGEVRARDERLAEQRRGLEAQVQARTAHLAEALEAARHASRAKSDFLARMSHEIRTPMNGVLGMAELLDATSLEVRQRRLLGTMRGSAESLLQVIGDILDFSKIEAGRMEIAAEPFCLTDVVEEVCELLGPRAHAKGLELACRVRPAERAWVRGDAHRLRQIVTNLVGNAVKFTDTGEIVVEATWTRGATHLELELAVEDTGIGLSVAEQQRIFEVFTQADAFATRSREGTGLGLSITRELLRLMGGTIRVESEPGVGSRFICGLELPLARAGEQARYASLRGARILVADDNATNREILEATLAAWDARVTVVPDGHRALAVLESGAAFDLVVLDQRMPGIDGLECAARIAARPADAALPVVILSSIDSIVAARHGAGAAEFLTKPVRQARLHEALSRALADATVQVPRLVPHAADAADAAQALGLRVLMVEDNPVNQEVAAGMLDALGCRYDLAGDGQQALGRLDAAAYDAVLMDCQMPVLDGYEATSRLREREARLGLRRTPVIALTANALQGDRERCLVAGMDEFLPKPYTLAQLEAVLRGVRRHGSGDDAAAGTAPGPGVDALPGAVTVRDPELDPRPLDELARLGRPELVTRVLDAFTADLEARVAELAGSVDVADYAERAHRLRSGALSVGATRFALAAGRVEAAARSGDAEAAMLAVVTLERGTAPLLAALAEERGTRAARSA